ncbi:Yos1-like protein [Cystobasidium minutum MCA 4210]|uniref:Yos1-like protein n=1 Tax=Cystobasidium minutum MCA 4210 TaxID=1397322 RepID=UPI0034CDAC82|eukprot:jgi/Rhomi1/210698/estExt_Genemark1.C_4_t10265
MGLGLGNILYITLLLVNGIAVLNEERFLSRIGWSHSALQQAQFQQYNVDPAFMSSQEGPGVKARLINLIGAVRTVMRIPLIPLNIMVILYSMVLG